MLEYTQTKERFMEVYNSGDKNNDKNIDTSFLNKISRGNGKVAQNSSKARAGATSFAAGSSETKNAKTAYKGIDEMDFESRRQYEKAELARLVAGKTPMSLLKNATVADYADKEGMTIREFIYTVMSIRNLSGQNVMMTKEELTARSFKLAPYAQPFYDKDGKAYYEVSLTSKPRDARKLNYFANGKVSEAAIGKLTAPRAGDSPETAPDVKAALGICEKLAYYTGVKLDISTKKNIFMPSTLGRASKKVKDAASKATLGKWKSKKFVPVSGKMFMDPGQRNGAEILTTYISRCAMMSFDTNFETFMGVIEGDKAFLDLDAKKKAAVTSDYKRNYESIKYTLNSICMDLISSEMAKTIPDTSAEERLAMSEAYIVSAMQQMNSLGRYIDDPYVMKFISSTVTKSVSRYNANLMFSAKTIVDANCKVTGSKPLFKNANRETAVFGQYQYPMNGDFQFSAFKGNGAEKSKTPSATPAPAPSATTTATPSADKTGATATPSTATTGREEDETANEDVMERLDRYFASNPNVHIPDYVSVVRRYGLPDFLEYSENGNIYNSKELGFNDAQVYVLSNHQYREKYVEFEGLLNDEEWIKIQNSYSEVNNRVGEEAQEDVYFDVQRQEVDFILSRIWGMEIPSKTKRKEKEEDRVVKPEPKAEEKKPEVKKPEEKKTKKPEKTITIERIPNRTPDLFSKYNLPEELRGIIVPTGIDANASTENFAKDQLLYNHEQRCKAVAIYNLKDDDEWKQIQDRYKEINKLDGIDEQTELYIEIQKQEMDFVSTRIWDGIINKIPENKKTDSTETTSTENDTEKSGNGKTNADYGTAQTSETEKDGAGKGGAQTGDNGSNNNSSNNAGTDTNSGLEQASGEVKTGTTGGSATSGAGNGGSTGLRCTEIADETSTADATDTTTGTTAQDFTGKAGKDEQATEEKVEKAIRKQLEDMDKATTQQVETIAVDPIVKKPEPDLRPAETTGKDFSTISKAFNERSPEQIQTALEKYVAKYAAKALHEKSLADKRAAVNTEKSEKASDFEKQRTHAVSDSQNAVTILYEGLSQKARAKQVQAIVDKANNSNESIQVLQAQGVKRVQSLTEKKVEAAMSDFERLKDEHPKWGNCSTTASFMNYWHTNVQGANGKFANSLKNEVKLSCRATDAGIVLNEKLKDSDGEYRIIDGLTIIKKDEGNNKAGLNAYKLIKINPQDGKDPKLSETTVYTETENLVETNEFDEIYRDSLSDEALAENNGYIGKVIPGRAQPMRLPNAEKNLKREIMKEKMHSK